MWPRMDFVGILIWVGLLFAPAIWFAFYALFEAYRWLSSEDRTAELQRIEELRSRSVGRRAAHLGAPIIASEPPEKRTAA